jgi:hypothetical protein
MTLRLRLCGGVAVLGLLTLSLSGCGEAKELCPGLEKLANITSPPSLSEINNAISTLGDATETDNNNLNLDVKGALSDAQAVKTAMSQPNGSSTVDQLLNTLNAALNGISNDCSQIVAGG